jgi:hypothetical protein
MPPRDGVDRVATFFMNGVDWAFTVLRFSSDGQAVMTHQLQLNHRLPTRQPDDEARNRQRCHRPYIFYEWR